MWSNWNRSTSSRNPCCGGRWRGVRLTKLCGKPHARRRRTSGGSLRCTSHGAANALENTNEIILGNSAGLTPLGHKENEPAILWGPAEPAFWTRARRAGRRQFFDQMFFALRFFLHPKISPSTGLAKSCLSKLLLVCTVCCGVVSTSPRARTYIYALVSSVNTHPPPWYGPPWPWPGD